MEFSSADIQRLAKLARLQVSPAEASALTQHFHSLFALVEKLQDVNTDGITPMSHPQDLGLRLRDDIPTESNQRSAFQAIAPQVENGLYLVPKVIE